MNKKILLLIGVLGLTISNVLADKEPDVIWTVDITNCSPGKLSIGNNQPPVNIPLPVNLGANCWHIPIANDFYELKSLLSGQSLRLSTIEIRSTGAWPSDECETSYDVNKFMETYIDEHRIKFQAEYHPTHLSSTDANNPYGVNPNKSKWHVIVDNQKDFMKEMPGGPPFKPYIHITYNSDNQITTFVGSQGDVPANLDAYNQCQDNKSSDAIILHKTVKLICKFRKLAVIDVADDPFNNQYSTISLNYSETDNSVMYSSRDNEMMPTLEVPLTDDYMVKVISSENGNKYSWKTDELDLYEISKNSSSSGGWTVKKNGNILATDAKCLRV